MPTVDVYVTSIMSNPAIRGKHERVHRYLQSARVPYSTHDIAGDEQAKSHWRRKTVGNEIPMVLVDGERVGSIEDLDEAVEFGELDQFLRLSTPANTITSDAPPPPPPPKESTTSSRATLDDFASLNLTPSELAQLESELASGSSFSSALPTLPEARASISGPSYTTTQHHSVTPLRLSKDGEPVKIIRPLGDRPLAEDVKRDDLEGLELDGMEEEELERMWREMEEEERRYKERKGGEELPEVPPELPEKDVKVEEEVEDEGEKVEEAKAQDEDKVEAKEEETQDEEPIDGVTLDSGAQTPAATTEENGEEEEPEVESTIPAVAPVTTSTEEQEEDDDEKEGPVDSSNDNDNNDEQEHQPIASVEGMGGAELSAPIDQIERLRLSTSERKELVEEVSSGPTTLNVDPVTALEEKAVKEVKHALRHEAKNEGEEVKREEEVARDGEVEGQERVEKAMGSSTRDQVDKLKEFLNEGDVETEVVVELNEVGVPKKVAERAEEQVESRVAAAIREGEL